MHRFSTISDILKRADRKSQVLGSWGLVVHLICRQTTSEQKNKQFENLARQGMVELPSELAIKAGLALFSNNHTHSVINHTLLQRHPSRCESRKGYVFCYPGGDILAKVFDDRLSALQGIDSLAANISSQGRKAGLIACVPCQYRNDNLENSKAALAHLEKTKSVSFAVYMIARTQTRQALPMRLTRIAAIRQTTTHCLRILRTGNPIMTMMNWS